MAGAAWRLLRGSRQVNIGHCRTLGIQARLMMLASVTALPLVVLAGVTAISLIDAQHAQLKQEVAGKVNALLNDIDRQIGAIQVELEVLAKLPSIQSGDLVTFDRQLRAAIRVYGTALVLHDTQGQQLINTNRPFGAPLPSATNTEMHDRVVATGRPQVSDLIMGATLHRPIISVGVPVLRDGHVVYVLAMGIGPEIVSALLKDQNLLSEAISPAWTIAILDRKGVILARNRELYQFLGKPVAPLLRKAMMSATEDTWILNITSDGTPVYSTFRRSLVTGWTVAIGIPREFVDGPVRRAWRLAVGGGVLFMALSLALAYWMAQGIRRPVHKLAAMTREMGGGEPVGLFHSGVRELNLVGDGLRDAAVTLAHNREHLEDMVSDRTRELKQAQETLLQSQKMEAIGQLTGGIAHDFNNLLTVAWGSLEMLEPRLSDEKNLRLLRSAQSAMSRGAELTGSLLAFARKQRLQPVLADLNSVIIEMTEMLRRSIGPSIEIRHAFASDLWPVLIDIAQIETALLNVAINARDAMPGGGTLLIETANISDEAPEEVAGCECVLVSMRDTGTGMSPEVMERAFEPFFTTKEIGKGTGLGLSMVFGVVRQSGGAVRLGSRIGGGTRVQIYLPRVNCAALPEAQSALPASARTSTAARILVVDDDPDVRGVTVECLKEIGYSVSETDSGRAALALLERGDPFDLVVMDQVMPGLSGQETVRLARRTRPGLKVLFMSGYAGMGEYEREAGHDCWLGKPFRAEVLVRAVSAALHHINEGV
jgi:signal transduction histidine kinase/ActR/RegA family two-component response regulator